MTSNRMLTGGVAALALFLAVGCNRPAGTPSGGETKAAKGGADGKAEPADHGDHGPGPHGGTVADWGGGKYHVEFTVDHPKQQATVYILGSDEKSPVPVKAKDDQLLLTVKEPAFQVPLKADPQKGDADGKASRFVGTHEKLGKEQEFAGTISGEVNGTPYAGDFKEEPAEAPKKDAKK